MNIIATAKAAKHARRNRKYVKRESTRSVVFDCKKPEHLDQLQGLKKIEVSPLAQKFVGCRVGENVTTDTPWIFIDKEKIEDHLEFYEATSDFFPIMADIKKMTAEKILIGTHHYMQDEKIEFYICLTPEAQEIILEAVEKEKKAIQEKIMNSFYPKVRKWKSLGSEIQVDSELNKSTRPLLVVDLDGCMPIQKQTIRFTIRDVENLRDGYIELVTTRSTMNLIMRKRLDIGIQSSPLKKNIGVQVMIQTKCNKNIQYSVELSTVKLTDNFLTKLHKFLSNKFAEFRDVLKLNFSLDLYYDDYKYLGKAAAAKNFVESSEIKSYQDVINCRRRMISCFSWNAIYSGIVAAAHASTPIFFIENKRPSVDIEQETVFETHLVLIWHYSDNVQPKLFLHATRDVTALSFCPYDANILVAGYNNGQIAVWDLTNKLDSYETRDFLNDIQQKNHLLIAKETKWFQHPLADNHVFPVLCCSLEDGHKSTVTSIHWIPSSKFIAPQRVYKDSDESEPHMQFITASIDGYRILVWDLYISHEKRGSTCKKKGLRLSSKPEALLQNISPLSVLKKNFQPVCRLIVKHLSHPVTSLLLQDDTYCYVARNPETLNDIDAMTYFRVFESDDQFDYTPRLYFTTGIGTFYKATWEASDYDPKFYAVDEKCDLEKFADVHDGPILVCEANPCLPNVILTIGGSVVAIWNIPDFKFPVFWRKDRERYLTGMWSLIHPLSFLVVRSDTHYELWNITERSNLPIQTFKYKGYKLTKLYKDVSRSHARKKTCVITDTVGAFKLYTVPSESMAVDCNVQESMSYLERLIQIKQNVNRVKENILKKQKQKQPSFVEEQEEPVAKVPEKTEPEDTEVKKEVPLTHKIKWEVKLENNMRKVLYEKKKINLTEIEKNRKVLQKIVAENNEKGNKMILRKSKREAIFKKARDQLIVKEVQKPRRSTIKFDTKALKETYLNEYKKVETEMMKKIGKTSHFYEFNWPKVLMRHKQRYKLEQL